MKVNIFLGYLFLFFMEDKLVLILVLLIVVYCNCIVNNCFLKYYLFESC